MFSKNNNYLGINQKKSNSLKHYKYVSKKKVNGKWRYYYDVAADTYIDGNTNKRPSRVKGYSKLQDILGYDERDRYDNTATKLDLARENRIATRNSIYENVKNENNLEYKLASHNFENARKVYEKTAMYRVDQLGYSIKRGRKKLLTYLEN